MLARNSGRRLMARPDAHPIRVDIEATERSSDPIRAALEARDLSVAETKLEPATVPYGDNVFDAASVAALAIDPHTA
jgi:hypothetical protein